MWTHCIQKVIVFYSVLMLTVPGVAWEPSGRLLCAPDTFRHLLDAFFLVQADILCLSCTFSVLERAISPRSPRFLLVKEGIWRRRPGFEALSRLNRKRVWTHARTCACLYLHIQNTRVYSHTSQFSSTGSPSSASVIPALTGLPLVLCTDLFIPGIHRR